MEEKILRLKEVNPKLWSNFEMATKDFIKLETPESQQESYSTYRARYAEKQLGIEFPHDFMIFITLVYLKGFNYTYQPVEKILCEIPFKYKDFTCWFTISKFGFDLTINSQDIEVTKELIKKLNNAIKIADKLCSPLIEDMINKGNITLENQSTFIRRRYEYFRKTAEELYTSPVPRVKKEDQGYIFSEFFRRKNAEVKRSQEGSFNAQAMLDAYFSLQEHLLVLLLPFCEFNKESENLTEFISNNWTTKFKRIFKPQENKELMTHFENLRLIKESYRNKSAHGEFEKNNGSFYVHFGILGAVPVQMSQYDKIGEYSFVSITDFNFEDICKVIDAFDHYLATSDKWKRPIFMISSGIDINYDDSSIKQYLTAIESDEILQQFIEEYYQMEDRITNMDW